MSCPRPEQTEDHRSPAPLAPPRAARAPRSPLLSLLALLPLLATIPPTRVNAQPYGLDSRPRTGAFLEDRLPANQPAAGQWIVVPAFPNLRFANPVGLVPEPGSHRLCVHTREGRIYAFENDPDVRETELLLDLTERTQGWDDSGLLGMAFHPEFGRLASPNYGDVYVFYQYSPAPIPGPQRPPEKTAAYNRLSRFTLRPGGRTFDPDSELILLDLYDRSVWHNGGAMFFHPTDGFLYLTLGDEGGVNAEFGNAQRIDGGLFAGVIRIDVNQDPARSHPIRRQPRSAPGGTSRSAHYFIPNDNPFLDPAGSVLEEFWCLGLRSPHRMTLDPVTGDIWLGDVGQGSREEVNLIVKGGNYQWAYREGNLEGPFPRPAQLLGTDQPPVYDYPHAPGTTQFDGNNCVIGGYVYRGTTHPDLVGKYVFGDNGSGRIWALTRTGASVTLDQIATMPPGFNYTGLSSFGLDHQNELYLCQMGPAGQVFKLARPVPSRTPPPTLSQTAAFTDLASLRPAASLVPYEVNSPLWSDAALKTRWIALPNDGAPFGPGERIARAPEGTWSFPAGTVLVKHFELAVDDARPEVRRRLETRFLVRDDQGGVYGITYKWRPDESDADLLDGAVAEELTIARAEAPPPFGQDADLGTVTGPGSTTSDAAGTRYTLSPPGAASPGGSLRFAYQSRDGDFDVSIRVDSLLPELTRATAGLMVRDSLAAGSAFVVVRLVPAGTPGQPPVLEVWQAPPGGAPAPAVPLAGTPPSLRFPDAWLRLRRVGAQITAYAGSDGIAWTRLAQLDQTLPARVLIGLAVSADPSAPAATATFTRPTHNRAQTWYYPSPRDCVTCHTPAAGHVLGVTTAQLNGTAHYPATGRADNQLRTWNHLGFFDPPLDEAAIPALARLVRVDDPALPLDRRVRSYLAANCSPCHRPGGVNANFDARYETPLALQGLINGSVHKSLGIEGARVISPGDLDRSILYRRLATLGEHQMPPLARNTVDDHGLAAVAAWVQSLPPVGTARGLRAEYYDNVDFTALKLRRIDSTVNADWGNGSPNPVLGPDTFSVRWSGELTPRGSGTYTFYTTSDDGVRLWIDDRLIIDNWTPHAPTENAGAIDLASGRNYSLRLEYFEDSGGAQLRFAWSGPGFARQTVPASALSAPLDPVIPGAAPLVRFLGLQAGQARLVIDADEPAEYTLESSDDFGTWTERVRLPNRTGLIDVTDATAGQPARFYRAVRRDP